MQVLYSGVLGVSADISFVVLIIQIVFKQRLKKKEKVLYHVILFYIYLHGLWIGFIAFANPPEMNYTCHVTGLPYEYHYQEPIKSFSVTFWPALW